MTTGPPGPAVARYTGSRGVHKKSGCPDSGTQSTRGGFSKAGKNTKIRSDYLY